MHCSKNPPVLSMSKIVWMDFGA